MIVDQSCMVSFPIKSNANLDKKTSQCHFFLVIKKEKKNSSRQIPFFFFNGKKDFNSFAHIFPTQWNIVYTVINGVEQPMQ